MNRRNLLLSAGIVAVCISSPAWAVNPAEAFVSGNIQAGFDILNDTSASASQRRERFAAFLLGLTDVRRVALFMLGRYAEGASQADLDAYVAAYQDHIQTVYQSYFGRYAGQTLHVTSSRERAPGDTIVTTNLAGNGAAPMEVDFRVRTDGARPLLLDIGVAGVWLAPAQREEFLAVLAQNHGDIKALSAHLRDAQAQ
jgi:phospholipid transport system substrate-binding protein